MRRILLIHCPTVRSTVGSSFGPITMSATTPMMTSLPQLMSNIGLSTPRGAQPFGGAPLQFSQAPNAKGSGRAAFDALLGVGARLHRRRGIVVVDDLHVGLARLGLGDLVLGHALLERLDALGDVAHQLG